MTSISNGVLVFYFISRSGHLLLPAAPTTTLRHSTECFFRRGGCIVGQDRSVAATYVGVQAQQRAARNSLSSSREKKKKKNSNTQTGRWSHAFYAHASRDCWRLCARGALTLGDPRGNTWLVVVLVLLLVNARLSAGTGVLTASTLHTVQSTLC